MVETNGEALEAAQQRYPYLDIRDAVDDGTCDECGKEQVTIYHTDVNWVCETCLHEYAGEGG